MIGFAASRLAKEDLPTLNGGENTELLISEGDLAEFEFTPSIGMIKGFGFCIHTNESSDGNLHIALYDNDVMYTTQTIPLAKYSQQSYTPLLVDWKLTPGKQYMMKVSITDNPSGIHLLVTPEGVKPQTEYGNAFLNQEYLGDIAPLSGIIYRGNIQTLPTKLYLSLCCGTFVLVCILAIREFLKILFFKK